MIGLGMEGSKLKLVVHTKGMEQKKWFNALFELVKGLQYAKKEVQRQKNNNQEYDFNSE